MRNLEVETRKQTYCNERLPVLKGRPKWGNTFFSYKQRRDVFHAIVLLHIKTVYVIFLRTIGLQQWECMFKPTQAPEKMKNMHG